MKRPKLLFLLASTMLTLSFPSLVNAVEFSNVFANFFPPYTLTKLFKSAGFHGSCQTLLSVPSNGEPLLEGKIVVEKSEQSIELRYKNNADEFLLVSFPVENVDLINELRIEVSTVFEGNILRLRVSGDKIYFKEEIVTTSDNPSRAVNVLLLN